MDGKVGKTGLQFRCRKDRYASLRSSVTFEDGSVAGAVPAEKVTILPQATSKVLELIHKILLVSESLQITNSDAVLQCISQLDETDRVIGSLYAKSRELTLLTHLTACC